MMSRMVVRFRVGMHMAVITTFFVRARSDLKRSLAYAFLSGSGTFFFLTSHMLEDQCTYCITARYETGGALMPGSRIQAIAFESRLQDRCPDPGRFAEKPDKDGEMAK
ncbi:hypothetical protein BC827DRAFT_1163791 [Russula dissimulans]|nr:hypothetical protein BC827DRAFT_1163791 [Russula dissimulans]